MPMQRTPALDRLYLRIAVHPLGCWEWQGGLNRYGYGVIGSWRDDGSKVTRMVHRLVYEDHFGPISPGLAVDHLCFNPRCCNPAHLEAVTRAENTKRQWRAGRADPGRKNRAATHCKRGHPFDAANTRVRANGSRACVACANLRRRKEFRDVPRTESAG